MIEYGVLDTAAGTIVIAVDGSGVSKVAITPDDWAEYKASVDIASGTSVFFIQVMAEFDEYLQAKRKQFTIQPSIKGTEFCWQVWRELNRIPYGSVRTYGDIAAAVGRPKAYRAIGLANYKNPVPILIPCHRVIGKDGRLVGYRGSNLGFKQYLLDIEKGA